MPENDREPDNETKPENDSDTNELTDRFVAEVKAVAEEGTSHPSAKPALIGAAFGAVIGHFLFDDGLGFLLGGAVGAAIAIYLQVKNRKD